MKKLRNSILFVIIALLLLVSSKVSALTYQIGQKMPLNDQGLTSSDISSDKGQAKIRVYNVSSTSIKAYCLDPSGYGDLKRLVVDRELVNNTKATGREYSLDVALKSILENESSYSYSVITNALRFATSSMGLSIAGNYPSGQALTARFMVTAASWISESEANYTSWYQAFYGVNPPKKLSGTSARSTVISALEKTQGYKLGSTKDFSYNTEKVTSMKNLFLNSLKAAANARMSNSKSTESDYKLTLSNSGSIVKSTKSNKTYVTRDIVYVVNTGLYDKLTGFVKNITLSSAYSRYMTLEYSLDGKTYTSLNSSVNLVSLGSDKVYIRIHIEVPEEELTDCDAINFTISYNYYDAALASRGYLLSVPSGKSAYSFPQRFVIYTKEGSTSGFVGTISSSTELCGDSCQTEVTIPKDCTELGESVQTEDVISKISAPEDVTKCVLKKNDDAGNTYRLSSTNGGVSEDNPYCSVWCKEDYGVVRFSGVKAAQSGRYFKVAGRIEGTKTCYTSSGTTSENSDHAINISRYEQDIKEAQIELVEAYKEYAKINAVCANPSGGIVSGSLSVPGYKVNANGQVSLTGNVKESYEYNTADCSGLKTQATNRLSAAKTSFAKINAQMNECSSWTSNFKFDQDIYYTYSDNYQKLLNKEDTIMNKSCEGNDCVTGNSDWYCSGDLSSTDKGKYNTCTTTAVNTNPIVARTYLYCDSTGCTNTSVNVSTAKYIKRSINAATNYETNNLFYNIYTSGKVTIEDVMNSDLNVLSVEKVNGSPVSVKTEKGVYTFSYSLTGLGEFYDTGSSGRISGSNNSVIKKLSNDGLINFDGDYICYYKVNCPECEPVCEEPGKPCRWNICPDPGECTCPDCKPTCVNCIYDQNELNVGFRSISTNDVNPNDRELGYNWNESTTYDLISKKAEATVTEIENLGASVENDTPILSVTMTPALAKDIRNYNNSQEANGGYTNESMECYNYTDGSKTYEKVFCFSSFLDDMSKKHSNAFSFINTRISESTRESSNDYNTISKQITASGYWTIYPGANAYKLGEYDGVVGGPSWK